MNDLRRYMDVITLLTEAHHDMKKELSFKELRAMIGAGRRRTGLYSLYDMNGNPTTEKLSINGEPVKVVIIWRSGQASFHGGITGEKKLAEFLHEPYSVDV